MNNPDFLRNTVPSAEQIKNSCVSFGGDPTAERRVLFIGNSITRHGVKTEIGWPRDCGMAASSLEKDYVHLVAAELERRFGKVCYCIAQLAEWERDLENPDVLARFSEARDFGADLVIVRIGENIPKAVTDGDAIEAAFVRMIRFFAVHPGVKILMTDLFWSRSVIDEAIARAGREVGAIPVTIGDLGADDRMKAIGEYAHHGVSVHPGDRGMRAIADRILERIGTPEER